MFPCCDIPNDTIRISDWRCFLKAEQNATEVYSYNCIVDMVHNQLTIDKVIHSFIFGVTIGVCLLVAWLQELNWA